MSDPRIEIRKTWDAIILSAGGMAEVRILSRKYTSSGYFDDPDAFVAAVSDADAQNSGVGIFTTFNELDPALLARACNRIESRPKSTTSDRDVTRRHNFFIDIDPVRVADVSANDYEHAEAEERARRIARFLRERGWCEPIMADSGNGFHLYYAIDLPVDKSSHTLVAGALEALDLLFSDDRVCVDVSVSNPARIARVYGTLACKGDSTPERPHRRSRLLQVPQHRELVSREQLQALSMLVPKKPTARPATTSGALDAFVLEHNIAITSERPWKDGRLLKLATCPFDGSHTNGDAYLIEWPNGARAFGCHHNSCRERIWTDFRRYYEPDEYAHSLAREPEVGSGDIKAAYPPLTTIGELLTEPLEPEAWIVDGLLAPGGVSMVVAKPKVGKSVSTQNLSLAVARGQPFLGRASRQGPVIYLALETRRALIRKQFRAMGATANDPLYLHIARTPQDAIAWLKWAIDTYKPVLVIIDTLQRFVRLRDIKDYSEATNKTEAPLQLARESGAHIMFTHHANKANSDDDVDAAMGSIGLSGTVDVILRMKKLPTGVRTLSAITMREGDELEEIVVEMAPDTYVISTPGTRKDLDLKAATEKLFAFLANQDEPVQHAVVLEQVEGRKEILVAALGKLVESGKIFCRGEGKRGDPRCYSRFPFPDTSGNAGTETKGNWKGPKDQGLLRSGDFVDPSKNGETGERNLPGQSMVNNTGDPSRPKYTEWEDFDL